MSCRYNNDNNNSTANGVGLRKQAGCAIFISIGLVNRRFQRILLGGSILCEGCEGTLYFSGSGGRRFANLGRH